LLESGKRGKRALLRAGAVNAEIVDFQPSARIDQNTAKKMMRITKRDTFEVSPSRLELVGAAPEVLVQVGDATDQLTHQPKLLTRALQGL
jgi:DNA-binding sugar fermentation-stimulating protein